jgi:hypothetical protein
VWLRVFSSDLPGDYRSIVRYFCDWEKGAYYTLKGDGYKGGQVSGAPLAVQVRD